MDIEINYKSFFLYYTNRQPGFLAIIISGCGAVEKPYLVFVDVG
jgi:hypothetical protein